MKYVLFLFLTFFSISLIGQKTTHFVELKPKKKITGSSFFCEEVIDKRLVKENIGFAQVGMSNKRVIAQLTSDFSENISAVLEEILPSSSKKEGLVFIFHEMNITEVTQGFTENGYCRMEIELARRDNDQLYSLGFYATEV